MTPWFQFRAWPWLKRTEPTPVASTRSRVASLAARSVSICGTRLFALLPKYWRQAWRERRRIRALTRPNDCRAQLFIRRFLQEVRSLGVAAAHRNARDRLQALLGVNAAASASLARGTQTRIFEDFVRHGVWPTAPQPTPLPEYSGHSFDRRYALLEVASGLKEDTLAALALTGWFETWWKHHLLREFRERVTRDICIEAGSVRRGTFRPQCLKTILDDVRLHDPTAEPLILKVTAYLSTIAPFYEEQHLQRLREYKLRLEEQRRQAEEDAHRVKRQLQECRAAAIHKYLAWLADSEQPLRNVLSFADGHSGLVSPSYRQRVEEQLRELNGMRIHAESVMAKELADVIRRH